MRDYSRVRIDLVDTDQFETMAGGLAEVLIDCVEGGASVGFLSPLPHEQAARWWRSALRVEGRLTWVARDDDGHILGVVQLTPAAFDNARHRAEVNKLLVHRAARGRGLGAALMTCLEDQAQRLGRTLLILDTQTGSDAERLYLRWGWRPVGIVDDHAATPDGRLAPTTIMTKRL